jgi:hypothetical protein
VSNEVFIGIVVSPPDFTVSRHTNAGWKSIRRLPGPAQSNPLELYRPPARYLESFVVKTECWELFCFKIMKL